MPTLKIEKALFNQLMGRQYTFKQLDDLGFQFGIQIQEQIQQKPDKESKHSYKFQCMNNRPDLLTQISLTRIYKIYLDLIKTPQLKLSQPTTKIIVDPSVKSIRPFVVGAVLRGIKFNETTFKAFINAQEKLHDTFCRARKYASIGTHDFDKIKGPFQYTAKDPKDFKFVPLYQQKLVDGLGMMQLFQNHKLKQYLHLIRDSPLYPLILDADGNVCSVPPIINSEFSKMSIDSKNIFIQVTALSRPKAMVSLITLVWAFSEYCEVPFQIQPVQIVDGEATTLTPIIDESVFTISHKKAEVLLGHPLTSEQVVKFLQRTGIKATDNGDGTYKTLVPCWRVDVLHECDILEDIAICYGFSKIVPVFPPSSTIGSQLRLNKFSDFLRLQMSQAQFNQALNFSLCSKADVTTNIFNQDESKLIIIENAKTKQFQTGRTTLLPGLLRTIVQNKSLALPYRLFEVGDCIQIDASTDTGAKNVKKIAAVYTDEVTDKKKKAIFSIIHGTLDLIMKKCNLNFPKDYSLKKLNNPFYFPGQQFQILLHGSTVGTLGVVHPHVLQKFNWLHPTVVWELDVLPLEKAFTDSYK